MNPSTGEVFRDLTDEEARKRGLVPISEAIADAIEIGMEAMNRAERRLSERAVRKSGRGYTR